MSELAANQRPMIDLEEFERRLRRPAAAQHAQDDPLTELARLVSGRDDPFKTVFEEDRHLPRAASIPAHHDEDFGADEPHLHGTIHPETYGAQAETYAAEDPSMTAAETYHQAQAEVQDYAWPDEETVVPAAAARRLEVPRSRRPLFVMAAIIAVGIAGIGASFAYKSSKTGPHEIATIKAMSGPTKIQPESPGAADVAKQDAAILDKSQQQTPVGLVDHKERPVDLALQRDAGGAASPIRMAEAVPPGGAAAVPVPTPPAGPQSASGQQELQSYGIGALIEPKRVKTVSVRSDGTLLPNDTPPPMPPSTASSPPSTPAAHPAAPAAATTPKPATPKSTARVVTTPKPAPAMDDIAGADNGPPVAAAPAPIKPKPVAAKPAPAKPVKLAEAEATDTIPEAKERAAGAGAFAVQFAAPGSEQEAHDMTAKLAQKYGAELSGHHLTYHRATVADKAVYRVRTSGLSRDEATGLCQKVKSVGGNCFVAKD